MRDRAACVGLDRGGIRREALSWCSDAHPTPADGAARPASHGICAACLAARTREFRRAGGRFLVWDEDAREGAGWAAELAAVEPEAQCELNFPRF